MMDGPVPGHGHWCEHCGGWFDVDHYEPYNPEDESGGEHKHGAEYGLMGKGLAAIDLVVSLLDLLITCECPHATCYADHEVEKRARELVNWSIEEARNRLDITT